MKIVIMLPFDGAEKETPVWAFEEEGIDFYRDYESGARCTMAFAAVELKRYLSRTLCESDISFSSQRLQEGFLFELGIVDKASKQDDYTIEPFENGVVITGYGRRGVLYGVYEFLRIQGWQWYAPGNAGEIAPELKSLLSLPEKRMDYKPSMSLGRGFFFEYISMESEELFIWMARNRLNMATYRPATGPLCSKLGMIFKVGGHIFDKVLEPDRKLSSGKTLWEEHEDWYGLPEDGNRIKSKALGIQFCVSQDSLLDFLGEELLHYLKGQWKDVDQIDIWGFDTWGNACSCEKCRSLGNNTDRTVFFISNLRNYIDKARRDGRLDRDVSMVMCSYEGTSTIHGPERHIPERLITAGDYVEYYPINRCYLHDFSDNMCSCNAFYDTALKSWLTAEDALPVMMGEYYNVSKFEDLPILFTRRIAADLPYYHSVGVRGMTYMHIPMVNWGMRTITQVLYAQLCWDVNTDVKAFLDRYFSQWYGPYAVEMRKVYELTEDAWSYCTQWRAWSKMSILSQLKAWDGAKPEKPLFPGDHFDNAEGILKRGRESIRLLEEALGILDVVRRKEKESTNREDKASSSAAVNPAMMREMAEMRSYEIRLGEDRRLLIYGLDTMTVMVELAAYHDALCRDDLNEGDQIWESIEKAADELDSYFIPIRYEYPVGLESKDGLTRSQVRELLRRIRSQRNRRFA